MGRWSMRRLLPDDGMVHDAPSPQAAVSVIKDWISRFPPECGVRNGGHLDLFGDERVQWSLQRLGDLNGREVLELGPLEGAHTYQLDRAGAHVTAIEGNKRSYLKCLITKEVMGMRNSRFLLGDFLPWLESTNRRFDAIWASGVLYHMAEPLRLLRAIAARTDKVFILTHYFPADGNPRRPPFFKRSSVALAGRPIEHFHRLYLRPRWRALACGGPAAGSCWLRRDDILFALDALGFSRVEIGFENRDVPYRHNFALVAQR
jgi:SAM-dependent methyltransferase